MCTLTGMGFSNVSPHLQNKLILTKLLYNVIMLNFFAHFFTVNLLVCACVCVCEGQKRVSDSLAME